MTTISASIKEMGQGFSTDILTQMETQMPQEAVIEIFKQQIVAAGKSATITELDDGSVRMTIHGGT